MLAISAMSMTPLLSWSYRRNAHLSFSSSFSKLVYLLLTLYSTGWAESAPPPQPTNICLGNMLYFLLFDFYYNGLKQILAKKEFKIFWGTPSSKSQNFKFFKSDPTWHPITKYFYCRISKWYRKTPPVYLKTLSKLRLSPVPSQLIFDKFIFDTVLIMLNSLPPLEFLTNIMRF